MQKSGFEEIPPYGLWPKSEFEARWKRAHELMATDEFDALILSHPDNIHYFTGSFFPPGWVRRGIAILPIGRDPILLVRQHQVARARLSAVIDDIRGHTIPMDSPAALAPPVIEILKELNVASRSIGAEMAAPFTMGIMYDEFEAIKRGLPEAHFRSCSNIIVELRSIKSRREIEAVRTACKITDIAHAAVPNLLKEGMNQRTAGDLLTLEMEKNGGFSPFVYVRDGTDGLGTMGSYKGYNEINANRPLRKGYLVIDMGCSYNYYWSDFSRHYWVGEEPPENANLYARISLEAIDAALRLARPGIKSSEIIRGVYDVMKSNGLATDQIQVGLLGLIGHVIGLDMVDLQLASDTMTPLSEGMTLTFEPAFMSEYGWWVPEVNLVITKGGNDLLSSYPKALVRI